MESVIPKLTAAQHKMLERFCRGGWKFDPITGLVDIDGTFWCSSVGITDFGGVRFGRVSRNFYCDGNQLTSLEGAPLWVGEDFHCQENRLTNLEGAPRYVGQNFECEGNRLTSLRGAPEWIGGNLRCSDNQLTSLEGAPERIGGVLSCSRNRLTSLEGLSKMTTSFCYFMENPIPSSILDRIFGIMRIEWDFTYADALSLVWDDLSDEEKVLMYRPEFKWIDEEEARNLELKGRFNGIRDML